MMSLMNKVSGCAHAHTCMCVYLQICTHEFLLKSIVLGHVILIEDFNTYCHLISIEF